MKFRKLIQAGSLILLLVAATRNPDLAADGTDSHPDAEAAPAAEQIEEGEVISVFEAFGSRAREAERPPAKGDLAQNLPNINWRDYAARPPQIDPLFVKAFTEIGAGHNDSNPVWSPTGEMLAFERSIDDRREIIISRFDSVVLQRIYYRLFKEETGEGTMFTGILEDASYNASIAWSPDESRLVFMSNGGSGNYDLYLLEALDQKIPVRLTDGKEKDSHAHWSPSADRLVFVSGRSGKADIYLMDLPSRNVTRLTKGHKAFLYPRWSPDGRKLAMIYGENENHDIYVIENIERPAETLKMLTRWDHDDLRPMWSPDGQKIAFYSNYNPENNPGLWSIVVIAADGSDPLEGDGLAQKVVAKNVIPDSEQGPAWMPDSRRIVYVKNDHQAYNPIYVADIESKINQPISTGTKMNHDVACSVNGILAFRAQAEQWDHIYIAALEE